MPSRIQGYEYDIFISYRQKDNKTGWVTGFVESLRNEIEASFKENISIYFDSDSHNGIHETHDVDGSLKEKIKCLIFIPIVSRTYCDPKSFSWQKEFLPFLGFSKSDKYGLDIKLRNGNVSKRVLPVRIHDIDEADKTIFEDQIAGAMRSIDFIYKEHGVSRPLLPEDDSIMNLNQTNYQNQINRVGNAARELLISMFDSTMRISQPPVAATPLVHSHEADNSIAVLPFVNMSGDADDEYFSDGITEEILNCLARVKGLKVAGRTSSFQFKNKQVGLREVGDLLDVEFVLEGSVRRQKDVVRITTQLINAKNGFHIWSERYDRELKNIFALQDEIALKVTEKLEVSLLGKELISTPPTGVEAYKFYLQGRYYLGLRTSDGVRQAIDNFVQSISIDSNFALSHAGLADAYVLASIGYAPISAALGLAKEASLKAISLNPNLSEPHVAAGYWYLNHGEYTRAYTLFQKAIHLNPNNASAYQWLAHYYLYLRKYEEAIPIANRAREIEPLSAVIVNESGWPKYYLGHFQEAMAICNEALNIDSDFMMAHYNLGCCLERLDEYEKATIEYEIAIKLSDNVPFVLAGYAGCLSKLGKADKAKVILERMHEIAHRGASIAIWIAYVYEAFGQQAEAIEWIEKSIQGQEPSLIALNTLWLPFDSLQADPRYRDCLQRLTPDMRKLVLGLS